MNLLNLQLQFKNGMLWLNIYQKKKLVDSQKNISFFLRGSNEISGKVEVTGKRVNIGDGVGRGTPKIH